MRIALDGMGGDFAPREAVHGAVLAVKEYGVHVTITGPKEKIQEELDQYEYDKERIEILDAREELSDRKSVV